MPVIRPSGAAVRSALAATRSPRSATLTATRTAVVTKHFSTTPTKSSSHGPTYDPPTGWLFGVKPGEKYKNEGWENIFFYGFCGSIVVFLVAYAFKPDTSIQTWALEEARRRLEAEGILEDPQKKS